jgi:hypothetical protein
VRGLYELVRTPSCPSLARCLAFPQRVRATAMVAMNFLALALRTRVAGTARTSCLKLSTLSAIPNASAQVSKHDSTWRLTFQIATPLRAAPSHLGLQNKLPQHTAQCRLSLAKRLFLRCGADSHSRYGARAHSRYRYERWRSRGRPAAAAGRRPSRIAETSRLVVHARTGGRCVPPRLSPRATSRLLERLLLRAALAAQGSEREGEACE